MKYGRLTILETVPERRAGHIVVRCLCDCGKTVDRRRDHVRAGGTTSCGCFKIEQAPFSNRKHGEGGGDGRAAELNAYNEMKKRCLNPNSKAFHHYGGRGITICARWLESYENFLADMGRRPSADHSIERDDVNGNYEPDNCRWATWTEQQRNKTNTKINMTIAREIRALSASGLSRVEVARRLGVHIGTVKQVALGKQWREDAGSCHPNFARPA
jgi:hypothetical protein